MASPALSPLAAEDLFKLAFVGSPRISPDGRAVVYTVKETLFEENRYTTSLWLVPTTGGAPRRLTFGKHCDILPMWSPDGRTVAFVSDRQDKRQQVYLLSMDGGEARPLTSDLDGSVSALEWGPDGKQLVIVYRGLSEEQKARREAEKKDEAGKRPAFKVHKDLHFKEDGMGFLFDTFPHLHVIDVETGKTRQVTDGETEDSQPIFSPDGKSIAFASNRLPRPLHEMDNMDICLVPMEGGEIRRLTPTYGPNVAPSFSPDGKTIAFIGHFCEKGESFWRDNHLWTVPAAGGEPRHLTPKLTRTVGNYVIADTREVGNSFDPPLWSADGKHLTFLISDSGGTQLCRVPAQGGEIEHLTGALEDLAGPHQNRYGAWITFVRAHHTRPAEVAILDTREGGEPRTLTHHNDAFLSTKWVGEPEEIWVPTEPGIKIHGWILKPPGFTAGKKYPAILEIHGGPHVQYGKSFFHEIQHLAGKGYVVLWTNPRGSQGYGEAHAGPIVKNWGGPDYRDLMAAVDHLVAQGYVDEKRLGVTGGSYGGYMTNWIIGHTDRFKAAVTQRSVTNLYSFYGESDFGFHFEWEFFGRPWESEKTALEYLRMSPITYVQNVKTPLLIVHSEEDHRCPVSQAEELFAALKVLDKEVEFLRFEGESHGLSRGGRPQNRLERLRRIGGWFDRYMG